MIVMKFGGTSLGSAERMQQVLGLALKEIELGNKPILVLSAMSGVTNLLLEGAKLALANELVLAEKIIKSIGQRHFETIEILFANEPKIVTSLHNEINEKLEELSILYKGVSYLKELSKRSLDTISGFGELLSSLILTNLAKLKGLETVCLDARELIVTDDQFGKASPIWDLTIDACRSRILSEVKNNKLVITQGFIARTVDLANTTLGRGGSDYSASIIGVALDAKEIQIWTDVDGMMSADPRVVPGAQVLSEVSFQEASELAYFGAKVLHPMTIHPAVEKNIPVRILNTLRPESSGTLIQKSVNSNELVRAIASKKNIVAIYINSPNMLMSHGYLAKVFEIFSKYKIAVDLISTSEVSIALTIDNIDNIENLEKELSKLADVQILKNVSIVTIVGRQFREKNGIAAKIFKALSQVNILMISGGASDINLSFVVAEEQSDEAVRELHREFFTSNS